MHEKHQETRTGLQRRVENKRRRNNNAKLGKTQTAKHGNFGNT